MISTDYLNEFSYNEQKKEPNKSNMIKWFKAFILGIIIWYVLTIVNGNQCNGKYLISMN